MKFTVPTLIFLAIFFTTPVQGMSLKNDEAPQGQIENLAQCLTDKGWTIFSSYTCSVCREQLELFGTTASNLNVVECHPHAPNTQVEVCIKRKIRVTPTWLQIQNDVETQRLKGYQTLEALSTQTGCAAKP